MVNCIILQWDKSQIETDKQEEWLWMEKIRSREIYWSEWQQLKKWRHMYLHFFLRYNSIIIIVQQEKIFIRESNKKIN